MCPSTYWASPASCARVIFNSEQYGGKKLECIHISGKGESKSIGGFCGPWWLQDLASGQKWHWCWQYVPAIELSAWQESKLWQVVLSGGSGRNSSCPGLSLKAGVAAVSGSFGLKSGPSALPEILINHSVVFL